eukprot:scaffold666_cov332-Prasinococcus_capsulatus_cf.AAC.3
MLACRTLAPHALRAPGARRSAAPSRPRCQPRQRVAAARVPARAAAAARPPSPSSSSSSSSSPSSAAAAAAAAASSRTSEGDCLQSNEAAAASSVRWVAAKEALRNGRPVAILDDADREVRAALPTRSVWHGSRCCAAPAEHQRALTDVEG